MTLTKEQSEEIKKQIISQVENLPNENKEQIKEYIRNLEGEDLIEFLKQNKIDIKTESEEKNKVPKCIFCSIVKKDISSYKLDENKNAIAVLEINPLSKGHSMIIPFKHTTIEKIPKSALSLAQKISKKIKKKLKPSDIKIESITINDHALINVIPLYKDEKMQKKQVTENELKELQKKLQIRERTKRNKDKTNLKKTETIKKQESNKPKLPEVYFRIP